MTMQAEGLASGETSAREVSWHDYTLPTDVSPDGRVLVFTELGEAGGRRLGTTYVRKTDGSPATRLGTGLFGALSPDGHLVAVLRGNSDIALLPTGAAREQLVRTGTAFEYVGRVAWLPDGRRLVLAAREPNSTGRLYVHDLNSGQTKAVTPEGVAFPNMSAALRVSPDGKLTAAPRSDGAIVLAALEDEEVRVLDGAQSGEVPMGWTNDSRAIFVYNPAVLPARVFRVDISGGRRQLWREIAPRDRAGVIGICPFVVTPDGRSAFYSYLRVLSELYMVEGVK